MPTWTSRPLPVPEAAGEPEFARADLEFLGVRHGGISFQVHVFIGNPDADEQTPLEHDSGYAGSFTVFGHGECFGDEGHCELPAEPRDPFDRRLAHPLTPANKTVTVSDRLRELARAGERELTVTTVSRPAARHYEGEPLHFDRLSLITYD